MPGIRFARPAPFAVVRGLALLLLLTGATLPDARAGTTPPSWRPDMPPPVRSLREEILKVPAYRERYDLWQEYARAHPSSGIARVAMAQAGRYGRFLEPAGQDSLIDAALAVDPDSPEALLQRALLNQFDPSAEPERLASRAAELAPEWADPHVVLWNLAWLGGRPAEADSHVVALVRKGGIGRAVLDYGHNMLMSARPDAIILTNGDNDTYPMLALQAMAGLRPDVTVLALPMMNLPRYLDLIWARMQPPPIPPVTMAAARTAWEGDIELQKRTILASHMLAALQGGMTATSRPIYFATTVVAYYTEPYRSRLELEGMLYRLRPAGADPADSVDIGRTLALFDDTFRLDSATDPTWTWDPTSAAQQLTLNYAAVLVRVAGAAGDRQQVGDVRSALGRAMPMLAFHHQTEWLNETARFWKTVDPDNPAVDTWLSAE